MQSEMCTSQWAQLADNLCATILRTNQIRDFYSLSFREQPIFSTRAHVFQIDPNTKKNWVPTSKHAVTVSYFYDSTRNVYRIISLDGSKVSFISENLLADRLLYLFSSLMSFMYLIRCFCHYLSNRLLMS